MGWLASHFLEGEFMQNKTNFSQNLTNHTQSAVKTQNANPPQSSNHVRDGHQPAQPTESQEN